jgi:hypothetical protein
MIFLMATIAVVGLCMLISATPARSADYFFRHPDLMNPPTGAEAPPNGEWSLDTNGISNSGGTYWWGPALMNNFVPESQFLDIARIEDGGVAYVAMDGGLYPGQIVIGAGPVADLHESALGMGTVEIRDGGVMRSIQTTTMAGSTNGNVTVGSPTGNATFEGTLRVLPGGELTAQGSLVSGFGNPNNSITVGGLAGDAAILEAGSAQLNALTRVYPNADFSTTSGVTFGSQGNSNYVSDITGNGTNGRISAGTTATLAGQLSLNFNSYTPSVGDSWTVLDANAFVGSFAQISTNANLAFNQDFVVSNVDNAGTRNLNVSLQEVLVLEVNRDSGTATLTHPGSADIDMDGYFVGSDVGALSFGNRVSVNNQSSLGGDWIDTGATPNNVGELKPTNDGTVPAGTNNINLGAIFDATAGPFGQDNEDLQFGYRSSDGSQSTGVVRYTGSTVNTLLLQVDPTGSGDAFLRNTSGETVFIDGYDVLSDAARLDPAAWNSLDEQGEDSDAWLEILNKSSSKIGEVNQASFTMIGPNENFNLGPLYVGGEQDLAFSFLMMGEEIATPGKVLYEAFAVVDVPGDYNQDGIVNAADYVVWRNHDGTGFALPNRNPALMGNIGAGDYAFWAQNYGSTSGAGSSTVSAVPEPASLGLILAALLATGANRNRQRRPSD